MIHTPIKFEPQLKTVLWGGDKIIPFKNLDSGLQQVGESWEISAVPGRESVVSEGPDSGLTLPQLIGRYGEDLVGHDCYKRFGTRFPLLVKFIDAKQDLSLQVHPGDHLAAERHNSAGKTEMWYVVNAEPDACVRTGLNRVIDAQDFERLVQEKQLLDVVATHAAHEGDVFYLPAGRIHSIGAGTMLVEVQQTSDITYRIYDYDRRGADGNPRKLHIAMAKDAIDYRVHDSYVTHTDAMAPGLTSLVACEHFVVNRFCVDERHRDLDLRQVDSFVVLVAIKGHLEVTDHQGSTFHLRRGETVLLPAITSQLHFSGHGTLIMAHLP